MSRSLTKVYFIMPLMIINHHMNKAIRISVVAGILLFTSCANDIKNKKEGPVSNKPNVVLCGNVLTAEEQAKLTPDAVLKDLKEGNTHFVSNSLSPRNYPEQARKSHTGQFPEAVILSCMDSRVPVELVFNKSIGDVFVLRVAGNLVNDDMLGSMEYGCKVSGAKLILVLGHEHCGAIKSAINGVKMGHITGMLKKIQAAIDKSSGFKGEKSSKNDQYMDLVCLNNILLTINEIKTQSPILKQMSDEGKIRIAGSIYHLETGTVEFLE